jgi:hypothetical protein
MSAHETRPIAAASEGSRLQRVVARLPRSLRRALGSRKTLALFLIALLGKLAFYGVLAWQLLVRR